MQKLLENPQVFVKQSPRPHWTNKCDHPAHGQGNRKMMPTALQVAEEFEFYRERWQMILDDLYGFDTKHPLIIEGAALLPELLAKHQVQPRQTLFLIPTLALQREHYEKRPWINHILNECTDPIKAFDNWMLRDHLFGQAFKDQAIQHNFPVITVDGTDPPTVLLDLVKSRMESSQNRL